MVSFAEKNPNFTAIFSHVMSLKTSRISVTLNFHVPPHLVLGTDYIIILEILLHG